MSKKNKVTTEQVLNFDYRKEENKKIMQKVLRQIKPLSKFSEEDEQISMELLEKTISVLVNKYEITPQWVSMNFRGLQKGVPATYSCGVKTSDTHEWLGTVYGSSLYELFVKLTIKMYSEVRSGNIPERNMTKEEKQRERLAKKVDDKENKSY
jgi:hypothetical protein